MDGLIVIAIFLVLLSAPLWVILLKRRVARWLTRRLEEKNFARFRVDSSARQSERGLRAIFFPLATSTWPVLVLTAFTLAAVRGPQRFASEWRIVLWVASSLAVLLGIVALYLHFSGLRGRKLKYDLIFSANLLVVSFFGGEVVAVYWLYLLACQVGVYFLVARINDPRRAISCFHAFQARFLAVMAVLLNGLLIPPYGLCRFHLVNVVSRRPILYFRSFRYSDGAKAFSQIVAKAARRFGIIQGLVHRTQRASDLQGNLDVVEQAHFSTSPDDAWQSWVLGKLRAASVVIVDATDDSESLGWEIARSIKNVGTARVAVLAKDGEFPPLPPDVWRLSYTLDRQGIERSRRELVGWLRLQLLAREVVVPLPAQEQPPESMSGAL